MSAQKATSKSGVPYLRRGPPGLVKWCNTVLAALDSQRVVRSVDVDAVIQPGGTLLTLRAIQPANKPPAPSTAPRMLAAVTGFQWGTPFTPNLEEISGALALAYTGPNNLGGNVTPKAGDIVLLGDTGSTYAQLTVFCSGTTPVTTGSTIPSLASSQFAWWTGAATSWRFFMAAWPTYQP